jgi:hypothetical protein
MQIRKKGGWNLKKFFSSETTGPISTKLCWNDPWMVPFQNCVRQRRPVSKMAAITKNRNIFKWPNLLYLSQKVPKFELYKHNDELFNICYGIYYELCHLKKFLFLVIAAILDTGRRWQTQFWKGTTQGSFQQSLVKIGTVVSEEKNFFKFHPPFFLICIIVQNRQKFKVHKKSRNIC